MTLEQSLKALKAAFGAKSSEAESKAQALSASKAKVEAQAAELSDMSEKLAAVSGIVAERDTLAAKVEELTKALAASNELKAQAVGQIESAGKVAAKIASAVGVAPAEISPADNVVAKSSAEVWSEYCSISNPSEKVAFYNKHRAAIVAHLGIK
jgi:chromosome segregation ATPase